MLFYTSDKFSYYCSKECREVPFPVRVSGVLHKKCFYCNQPFDTYYYKKDFCSRKCKFDFNNKPNEEKHSESTIGTFFNETSENNKLDDKQIINQNTEQPREKKKYVTPVKNRFCPECYADFKIVDKTQIFCSEKCRIKHYNKIEIVEPEKVKKCLNCGTPINKKFKGRFCSASCKSYYKHRK